ncbi:MAG: SET domain-containing protein [Ignavibacteriaceae bacterium]
MQKKEYPHYKVFTRLAPSKIHGIGVFAIQNIKKGMYVFYHDDDDMIWIPKSEIKEIPPSLKKLYKDFCILKDNSYGSPPNFNLMTTSWYLNHSDIPNVRCDKNYRFYALRNIKNGEELTVDYNSYSESNRI